MASSSDKPMRAQVEEYVFALQDRIVAALEALDPNAPQFKRDSWVRAQGGQGRSCVFATPSQSPASAALASDAAAPVLEKAGVNISIVHGTLPPAAVRQMRENHASIPADPARATGLPFYAAGLSLVVHPRNPHAPTVHMNVRYFEISGDAPADGGAPPVLAWWFGGGGDLTPSYLYEDDAVHFHGALRDACAAHGAGLYPAFKTWCDAYFHIPHRGEARGIGGIFFDDLCDEKHPKLPNDDGADAVARPRDPAGIFAFVRAVGDSFIPAYMPLLERRMRTPTTDEQRRWQLLRRGRYVEFNLVYDRGTKFGLNTPGARIESILISMPETARWEYMSEMGAEEGTEEARMLAVLRTPREWV
jgi:coproporphyrinogen III oxidase